MTETRDDAVLGQGEWTYRMLDGWAQMPTGWIMGDVGGVAIDANDNVYVFNRGQHPMIVFDVDGNFLRSWGEGIFTRPHGVSIGADGLIYCTDDGDHTVRVFTPEGKVTLEIGIPHRPSKKLLGQPFNRCTHTALSPKGEIYVADGYGNARIHKYSPDGKLLMSWGNFGSGDGEFNLPHNITCDPDGWVYVADRENHRVQIFDGQGRYETQWRSLHRPCGLCTEAKYNPISYIGEIGPGVAANRDYPNLGPRISIVDHNGNLLSRLGDTGLGMAPGKFLAPHGLATDSYGSIYVGEIGSSGWKQRFPDEPVPDGLVNLKKLVKVSATTRAQEESNL